jgi:hypothetical protein
MSCICDVSTTGLSNLFCERVTKLSMNFKEIISRDYGNSEKQNKVLEPSIIIINYCIIITIIINAHYNYIVELMHSTVIFLNTGSSRNTIRKKI